MSFSTDISVLKSYLNKSRSRYLRWFIAIVLHNSILSSSSEVCIGISATLDDGVDEKQSWELDVSPVKHNVSENITKEKKRF